MIRLTLLSLSVLIAFNTANAQMGGGRGGGDRQPQIPDVEEESLIFLPPANWTPFGKKSDGKTDTYAFPKGQEPADWQEAIHYEQYVGTQGVTQARQVFELRTQGGRSNCEDQNVALIKQEPENGYSMVEWSESCTSADESIMHTLNKVILGNEKLYSVSKAWKFEPEESEMGIWLNYMDQVYVCDPNTGVNDCRPLNPPADRRRRR
ncbi:MAG: hypothetical protein HOJ88_10720 [Proteobacteria bacterium]|nr:hypothetical protein [Pseudomonadota bacterium]